MKNEETNYFFNDTQKMTWYDIEKLAENGDEQAKALIRARNKIKEAQAENQEHNEEPRTGEEPRTSEEPKTGEEPKDRQRAKDRRKAKDKRRAKDRRKA